MRSEGGQEDKLIGCDSVERVTKKSESPLTLILSRFGAKQLPKPSGTEIVSAAPLRHHNPQEWSASPLPYLRYDGTLVIPLNTHPRYRYWGGGQDVAATLKELSAAPEVFRRYVDHSGPGIPLSDERGGKHE